MHAKFIAVMLPRLVVVACLVAGSWAADDDDFSPNVYSPDNDVELVHKYPHLGTSLQKQDRTFFSEKETTEDYFISLIMFPAVLSGSFLICVSCMTCFLCFRCCVLGCINCFKSIFRLCFKDCCRKSKEQKAALQAKSQKRYAIYSKTFPFLLFCSFISIVWVWEGAYHMDNGVKETREAMTKIGDIAQAISDELSSMTESSRRIDAFLSNNTCGPEVSGYLTDIEDSFQHFTNSTTEASNIIGSIQPAVDKASNNLQTYWRDFQEIAFDMTAVILLSVICTYCLGVCMKTAILMRLGLLLTIVFSFALCIVVFIEMTFVMGYADFCMAPTYHLERSLRGNAKSIAQYYTTCQGEGPLFRPIDDSQLYNSLMNTTYIKLITDEPDLDSSCRDGAISMEDSFAEIAIDALDIIEYARCPYIHEIYSHVILKGFCDDSYSGFYNIHVSHLATLSLFFTLMVNAALLYPLYKGKTLQRICPCLFYKKQHQQVSPEEIDEADEMLEDLVISGMVSDSDNDEDIEKVHPSDGDTNMMLSKNVIDSAVERSPRSGHVKVVPEEDSYCDATSTAVVLEEEHNNKEEHNNLDEEDSHPL